MKPFIGILANGFAIYLVTRMVDGVSYEGGLMFFIVAGVVLGLINFIVKHIII